MAAPVGLVMWPPWRRADELHCSFCKKSQRDVAKLIAGPDVFICSECVDICSAIVANDTCTIGDPRSEASESLETPVQCRLCAMVFPVSMMLAVRDRGSICRPCAEAIAEAWER